MPWQMTCNNRARLVSRYADDGGVQALALSLVPADLASVIGERKDHSLPTVTRCVALLVHPAPSYI